MTHSGRAIAAAVLVLLAFPLIAQEPWDGPAFSADPQALLDAAARVPAEHELVIVLSEETHTFDAEGKAASVERTVYRAAGESAVTPLATVRAVWAPWYYDRPTIAARVVSKDGVVHTLDPASIVESPAEPESPEMFTDSRVLRAPLPGVGVGSVVEVVVTQTSRNLIPDAGINGIMYFGLRYGIHHARLTLDGPAGFAPRFINRSGVEPVTSEENGRRRIVFDKRRVEPVKDVEDYLPPDTLQFPHVAYSTGKSWQDLARRYSEIVDRQIAGSDLKKMVKQAIGNATDRREIVVRALAAVQKDIRYAGVETGEGAIIPRPPKVVLQNRYGDCKDKATLLVAMLREAGLSAHVALLHAGHGFDVWPDLPGLGSFNHVIVVVDPKKPGEEPLWVDPTDVFARAGELPLADQGRMALIAKSDTTALIRTPEAPPSQNARVEQRTITLPENGRAYVQVAISPTGVEELAMRRFYATTDRKTYREAIERSAKAYHRAKSVEKIEGTDPRDLATPFRLTFEATESRDGAAGDGEAAVVFHPGGVMNNAPDAIHNWDAKKAADEKKRKHDFYWPTPYAAEFVYRIKPPAGYVPRTLPPSETKQLGTTTLTTTYETQPNNVVIAKIRFDSGKRRLTPEEFEATRVALSKLYSGEQTMIGFEQVGFTKLSAGDVGGALAEFRHLAEVHPNEAQHHIELATALLHGGLADAAREEARRAITLEPTNVRAHRTLGWILQHDRFGRYRRAGFDLAGSIAAFRKAKEVDPKDVDARVLLARSLLINEDGEMHGRGSRVAEAIDEYRALTRDLGSEGEGYEDELLVALLTQGRHDEAKEVVASMPASEKRDAGRILTAALTGGAEAAIRELNAFDQSTRGRHAHDAAQMLTRLRMYPAAAQLFEVAAQASKDPAVRQLVTTSRRLKRLDAPPVSDGPVGTVQRGILEVASGIESNEERYLAQRPELHPDEQPRRDTPFGPFPYSGADEMPRAVLVDMMLSLTTFQSEGSDANGYRVRSRTEMTDSSEVLYLLREGDAYKIGGGSSLHHVTGWSVLRFLEAGNLEAARTWLNWAREDLYAAVTDDPLARPSFTMLWAKDTASATAEQMRLAAATLMVDVGTLKSLPILLEAREKVTTDNERTAIDLALLGIHQTRADWKSMVPIAARVAAAHPDSESAFLTHVTSLTQTGDFAAAEALAKKRLERRPRDRAALRALVANAAAKRDYENAVLYGEQLLEQTSAARGDYNNVSWFSIFAGKIDRAIEHGRTATAGERKDAASLHTLATAYAEAGKSLEAREALLASLDERSTPDPESHDWYVLGRIAETYGATDIAIDAYGRVKKDERGAAGGDTFELAERRLAALKPKKKR